MGNSAQATVCYGFQIGYDLGDLKDPYEYGWYDKKEVVLDRYGSHEGDEEWFIGIHESVVGTDWEECRKIDFTKYKQGWDTILKEFCEKHSIEFKQPSWIIAAYWG